MACSITMSSVAAVRAQANVPVASASSARAVPAPARKSFNGVALSKGAFKSQQLVVSRRVATQAVFGGKKKGAEVDPLIGTSYDALLEKPIKAKFARGNDGGAFVVQVPNDPAYEEFNVGDKIVEISASFGPEVWKAENYGQVMFAMKTRSGGIFMKLERRGGDMSVFEMERSDQFTTERNSGNYGVGTKEIQEKNYMTKKELEKEREVMFNEAMELFKAKKFDQSLVIFENVVGLEPQKYIADNFAAVTDILKVAQYNVACCYSKINEMDAGLEALEASLKAGFDDYAYIRNDPNLANLREDEGFKPIMDKYDEPFLNENAMNVLKGLFGKKK